MSAHYHADFWSATAQTGPVLIAAHLIVAVESYRAVATTPGYDWRTHVYGLLESARWGAAVGGIFGAMGSTLSALASLSAERDWGLAKAHAGLVVSLVLLIGQTAAAVVTVLIRARAEARASATETAAPPEPTQRRSLVVPVVRVAGQRARQGHRHR